MCNYILKLLKPDQERGNDKGYYDHDAVTLWIVKGYYDVSLPPAEYTPDNPLCRFKAVGYSRKPTGESRDGFVSLIFKKKDSDVRYIRFYNLVLKFWTVSFADTCFLQNHSLEILRSKHVFFSKQLQNQIKILNIFTLTKYLKENWIEELMQVC